MLIGSGLGAFDRHVRDSGISESVFPNVRDRPLGYYATNSWLVSRAALQHSMKALWETLRNASLLPNMWRGFATPARIPGHGHTAHSEMGLIYEHVFHLALGLPVAVDEAQAWGQRAADAQLALDANARGCGEAVALFRCNSTTRCSPHCKKHWPRKCGAAPPRPRRSPSRRVARREPGFQRAWGGRRARNHSSVGSVPSACANARPAAGPIAPDCFLVVLAHSGEDVRWLRRASLPYLLINKSTVPNTGLDASTYLWFIVQNYDQLPWFTYFTHAHEYAWHHNAYSQLATMQAEPWPRQLGSPTRQPLGSTRQLGSPRQPSAASATRQLGSSAA